MFNKDKKQYINILQQNKQLKINYKIIQENNIIKEEQSSFIITDETLANDAKFKINSLQKDVDKTYITTLYENENQQIVKPDEVHVISHDSINIANNFKVISPKNEIQSIKRYYEGTGLDFIISPYTIIEEYLKDNGKKNSLNFFIYNNTIYTIIFDKIKNISFSKIKVLTPFESTQDETFLEDDIVGQKLYEEVNFLEIQQFLDETVEEYYGSGDNVDFIENIEMLYSLKPISDEQITTIQDALMIPISYKAISVDRYIDEIVQEPNSTIYNFISPRIKKENKSPYIWIGILVAILLLLSSIFTLDIFEKEEEQKPKKIKEIQQKSVIEKKVVQIKPVQPMTIELPSHKNNNTVMIEKIQMLFDVLPYDAVLKDIEINKHSSTFVSNFIVNSDSLSDMQTKLRNIYLNSKILLQNQNKVILNTIIQNDNILQKPVLKKFKYKQLKFLSLSQATDYLTSLAIPNSVIKFNHKSKEKYFTYSFSLVSKIKSPEEFISFIKKLNMQKLSVEVNYPIIFSKTTKHIEVKYNININQQNKKEVSLKK